MVPNLNNPSEIAVSASASCAIDSGSVVCWGTQTAITNNIPSVTNPRNLSASLSGMCVIDDWGFKCWGVNDFGQMEVKGGDFIDVTSATYHTCVILANGQINCWGTDTQNYGLFNIPQIARYQKAK